MNIGEKLKTLREQSSMSVYKLAKLSEISSTHIHAMENGETIPTIITLEKLCFSLGTTLEDFFQSSRSEITPKQKQLLNVIENLPPNKIDLVIELAKAMQI